MINGHAAYTSSGSLFTPRKRPGFAKETTMATTEFGTQRAGAADWLRGIAGTLLLTAGALVRAAQNRRAVAKLLEWDERALSDIGLTGADVRSAMAAPVGIDPSLDLRQRSAERRSSERAYRISHGKPRRKWIRELPTTAYPFADL
jgi:uncharacterized protein YjiS (DUF1127 family)